MLRLALVIDSDPVCRYVGDLLEALAAGDAGSARRISLSALVMPARRTDGKRDRGLTGVAQGLVGFELASMRLLERWRRGIAERIGYLRATPRDIRPLFAQVISLSPGESPMFDESPDVVLVLGSWLPSRLLERCPGATALQVEFGERPSRALALAGFEECWSGQDATRVRLYRLGKDGSRRLLVDGANRTKRLLSLNQAAIWDRALSLLATRLRNPGVEAPRGLPDAADPPEGCGADPAGGNGPRAAMLASYPLKVVGRGAKMAMQQARGQRQWSIAIYRRSEAGAIVGAPAVLRGAPAGTYPADPMLYRDPDTGRAYCFVEEVVRATRRGHIAVLGESDGRWSWLGVAIREPFHLSFPFLFRFKGDLYMCPESAESGEIRVYRCTGMPLEWELDTVLMRNVSATDTMLFPHAGRWWMLTNIDRARSPDHQSELHVFHADSPLATDWQALPGNPVRVDCRGGRNGGLEIRGGRIYRFGQLQSFNAYGQGLNRYEVTRLDADAYEEVFREAIVPPPALGAHGIHTYSGIDGWLAVDLLGARHA